MSADSLIFLPGVPQEHVMRRLNMAGGNEVGSGKLGHPESSSALAVNTFGWFIDRAELFPPLPGTELLGKTARIEVEYSARFPWSGGTHPWLDAFIMTDTHIIGVESKRFEPFRDAKRSQFSPAYDRPVWGAKMEQYHLVRRCLNEGAISYEHLDCAQLVKHAYGLVTEARRLHRIPLLYYVFAEPYVRAEHRITPAQHLQHRLEIADFANRIAGDEVGFAACSYRDWFQSWTGQCREHARNVIYAFEP